MNSRQKSGGPINRTTGWKLSWVRQDNEGGQILIFRTEAVRKPGTQAGEAIHRKARIHLEGRRSVIETLGRHRIDEGHIVHAGGEVGKQLTHPQTGLTMLAESKRTFHQAARLAKKSIDLPLARQFFSVMFDQIGLVIVSIQMANTAAGTDVNDTAGSGRKVRRLWPRGRSRRYTG